MTKKPTQLKRSDPGIEAPTHWADDRGYFVTDEWLQSPKATSDYRAAYNIPGRMVRGKFKPLDSF